MTLKRINDFLILGFGRVMLIALGLVPLFGGVGIFCWQLYHYFQSGMWQSVSLLDCMRWAGIQRAWAENPTSWFGLRNILNFVPASISGVLFGLMMTRVMVKDIAEESKRQKGPSGPEQR